MGETNIAIQLIALDLDGTLALENHQVSPATREALQDLHENGVEVVIATGRRYRTTRHVIDNLGFEVFAVCNGGALVKNPDQTTLHSDSFHVSELVELSRSLELSLFAQRDAHEHGGPDFIMDSVPSLNTASRNHIENNSQWCELSDLGNSESEFMVAGCFNDETTLNRYAEAIHEAFPGTYNTIVVPHLQTGYFYCEVSLEHIDKWQGLKKVADLLDVEADEVCTVGDQLNDMAMVEAAGHGVAMENGHDDLKRAASFVCGHNERDGILDVVNYIHEHNRSR